MTDPKQPAPLVPLSSLETACRLIGHAARWAKRNAAMAHDVPLADRYFARAIRPQPGDMVVETSSFAVRNDYVNCVGKLVSVGDVTMHHDDGTSYTREVWTIETLDGRTITWENCEFIVVPEGMTWLDPTPHGDDHAEATPDRP